MKNAEAVNIERALTVFAQTIVEDRKALREDLKEDRKENREGFKMLTNSVNELTLQAVEARKEREGETKRSERIEGNQKEQGQEMKNISDTVLKHTGKIKVLEDSKKDRDKIKISIYASLSILTIVGIVKLIGVTL